jgi:hypothetical protein
MQFNLKNYQKIKIVNTLKKNNFLLFTLGANQNSQNWIVTEQNLHKLTLAYTKTYNNTATKILENSIFKNLKNSINSTFFFLKPTENKKTLIRSNIVGTLSSIQFLTLTLKLNKKVYAAYQFKTVNSFHYKKSVSITYQFLATTLKLPLGLKIKENIKHTRNNVI